MIDIRQTFQTWKSVLLNPNLQTFETEKSKGNFLTALLWMAIVGFIGNFIGSIIFFLVAPLLLMPSGMSFYPFGLSEIGIISGLAIVGSVLAIVILPISLLIGSVVLFLLAKLLGGTGDFEIQTYLLATFAAPIWFISRIIGIVPIVGWLIVIGLGIYQLYLGYLAIQATHHLSQKRTVTVISIPVIASLMCFCGLPFFINFYLMSHFSGNPRVGFIFKPSPSYPDGCPPACASADFSGTNLFDLRFSEADLNGANLSGADARATHFRAANLRGANLKETDLRGAWLSEADLSGADLSGANLQSVSLYKVIIDENTQIDPKWKFVWEIVNHGPQGRDLREIDLNGANLQGVDLNGVDFSNSNLSNVDLGLMNLSNANLRVVTRNCVDV